MLNDPFAALTSKIFVGLDKQTRTLDELLVDLGLEFRRNKTAGHLNEAIQQGLADGKGKVERELFWVQFRLTEVLKKVKKPLEKKS